MHLDGRVVDLRERTYVMGVLNVTPDSFSDGGKYMSIEAAVARAVQMEREGADFIDVGGESSRPGADPIGVDEEIRRVVPVLEVLRHSIHVPLSIDTYKAPVAEAALDAGASFVNDISALTADESMGKLVAERRVPVVLMHIRGNPKTMQDNPTYRDVVAEVKAWLRNRVAIAKGHGIEQVVIDPGIGFGKRVEDNLSLLNHLDEFLELGLPILVGPSRKSFIGAILDLPVENRLEGTAAAVAISIARGANIIRVHDVKEMVRVARVVDSIIRERVIKPASQFAADLSDNPHQERSPAPNG